MSEQIISLIAAFGFGSVATALVQSWLELKRRNDDRRFEEKKLAFVGLLEAYHRAAVDGTEAAAKEFGYWQIRCELVASNEVIQAIAAIVDTNDSPEERAIAHEALKQSMREDLRLK